MSSARVFRTYRLCTTLLSQTALRRPPPNIRNRLLDISTRHYSNDKNSTPTEANNEAKTQTSKAESSATNATEQSKEPLDGSVKGSNLELLASLKAKEAEVLDLTTRLRYLQADFLNLQRNTAREKEHLRDYAITHFAEDLLETADVLAMALKSVPKTALLDQEASRHPSASDPPPPDPSATSTTSADSSLKSPVANLIDLYTGVEMTQRLLLQTFFKYHIKPFDPVGDKFDPNLHEALYQVPTSGKEPGTVVDCQKLGYKIKERVLRAAQVGVAHDPSS